MHLCNPASPDLTTRAFRRARGAGYAADGLNRLCDPDSKLGVLRWAQTVSMPCVETSKITHQQQLHAMDALMDHQAEVDEGVAHLLRPLIDETLSVVFYDLTTIRAYGGSRVFWRPHRR